MGAMGGLLGTSGGASGTGFSKPQDANILAPVGPGQVKDAGIGVNNSLESSKNLLKALSAQPGTVNQADVYNHNNVLAGQLIGNNGAGVENNATGQQMGLNAGLGGLNGAGAMGSAMGEQGGLNGQLGAANGVGVQRSGIGGLQDVLRSQQGLAGQYQNVANGTGPNPAQAALNQSTGQNVANQAALMAGQRGAGANVGLMARQAAQQGAATQQQAVGQNATMQAQQQLAGMSGLAGLQTAMGNTNQGIINAGSGLTGAQQAGINAGYGQGSGAVNQQQAGIGQQFQQGASGVGQQQAQQGIGAGIAQNQVGNLIGANTSNMQGNLGNAGQILGAAGQYNTNVVGSQGNVNTANASLAGNKMGGQNNMLGGMMNGIGAGFSSLGKQGEKQGTRVDAGGGDSGGGDSGGGGDGGGGGGGARGGLVEKMAYGGDTSTPAPVAASTPAPAQAPSSSFGQFLQGWGKTTGPAKSGIEEGGAAPTGGPALQQGGSSMMGGLGNLAGLGAGALGGSDGQQHADTEGDMGTGGENTAGPDSGGSSSGGADSGGGGGDGGGGMMAAEGGNVHDYRGGGHVVAKSAKEKAKIPGNSYKNDKIKALVSEDEIVLPRDVTESEDPVKAAAQFVAKVIAKRRAKR